MSDLASVDRALQEELRPGIGRRHTYADRYLQQLERLKAAAPSSRHAEAAILGGIVKSWRRHVIEEITEHVLGPALPGRERVRDWQRSVFGQALASGALNRYAMGERSGGGRGMRVDLPPALDAQCKALYLRHKDALRREHGKPQ